MALTPSITLQDVYTRVTALVAFVVGDDVEIVQGLGNRVPMPARQFVCMTATLITPHRTPVQSWEGLAPDAISIEQGITLRMQLDCYGPISADWAAIFSAILRTEQALDVLGPSVASLFAEPPMQAALVNGEEQYEERWIVGAILQYNPVISVPQEFADALEIDLINVDERYPP